MFLLPYLDLALVVQRLDVLFSGPLVYWWWYDVMSCNDPLYKDIVQLFKYP